MAVRSPRAVRLIAATVALGGVVGAVAMTSIADAVDDVPTAEQVIAAQQQAAGSARSVAEVKLRLAHARAELDAVTIRTAQLSEAYNGARYRLAKARSKAAAAQRYADLATAQADRQLQDYREALVTSYQLAPELQAWSAVLSSDGIEQAVERSATLSVAEDAMGARYDELEAARAEARRASAVARQARARADRAAERAKKARDAAAAAQVQAEAKMADIEAQERELVARWAELQGISISLAEQRNNALASQESGGPAPAAESAGSGDGPATPDTTPTPEPTGNPQPTKSPQPTKAPSSAPPTTVPPSTAPPTTDPTTDPTTGPPTTDPNPPPPGSGAQRAIAFARAQLGEPYRWGASGPNAWDCSGLTMGAWSAGGKALPHYSVAQYQQSTPISRAQLQPGDLVFWGSSSRSSSIYHVALYIGNGRIIHAPRTGRPVAEESIDYWIAPNFFARP